MTTVDCARKDTIPTLYFFQIFLFTWKIFLVFQNYKLN